MSNLASPWTLALQSPPSMRFFRQEYWSGLPCPSSGDLLHPEIKLMSPVAVSLQVDSLPLGHQGRFFSLFSLPGSWRAFWFCEFIIVKTNLRLQYWLFLQISFWYLPYWKSNYTYCATCKWGSIHLFYFLLPLIFFILLRALFLLFLLLVYMCLLVTISWRSLVFSFLPPIFLTSPSQCIFFTLDI